MHEPPLKRYGGRGRLATNVEFYLSIRISRKKEEIVRKTPHGDSIGELEVMQFA